MTTLFLINSLPWLRTAYRIEPAILGAHHQPSLCTGYFLSGGNIPSSHRRDISYSPTHTSHFQHSQLCLWAVVCFCCCFFHYHLLNHAFIQQVIVENLLMGQAPYWKPGIQHEPNKQKSFPSKGLQPGAKRESVMGILSK